MRRPFAIVPSSTILADWKLALKQISPAFRQIRLARRRDGASETARTQPGTPKQASGAPRHDPAIVLPRETAPKAGIARDGQPRKSRKACDDLAWKKTPHPVENADSASPALRADRIGAHHAALPKMRSPCTPPRARCPIARRASSPHRRISRVDRASRRPPRAIAPTALAPSAHQPRRRPFASALPHCRMPSPSPRPQRAPPPRAVAPTALGTPLPSAHRHRVGRRPSSQQPAYSTLSMRYPTPTWVCR